MSQDGLLGLGPKDSRNLSVSRSLQDQGLRLAFCDASGMGSHVSGLIFWEMSDKQRSRSLHPKPEILKPSVP